MTLRSVQYDFQQCIMLHIALGNNIATGYNLQYHLHLLWATGYFNSYIQAKLQEMKRQELQLQIVQKPKRLSVEPVHVAEPDSHTSPGLSVSNMHRIDRPRPPSPMVYVGLVNKAATQLSEDTPLTQDEIDALQKLIEGTGVNIDDIIATGQGITLEEAQQMLAEKGYAEDAGNLKTRLQESTYLVFHV